MEYMKQAEIFTLKGKVKDVLAQLKNMTEEEFEARKKEAVAKLRGAN